MSSCKTSQSGRLDQVSGEFNFDENYNEDERVRAIGNKRFVEQVGKHSPVFETLQIPRFSVKISSGNKTESFKGSLRIQRDSIIYMTIIPAMGIEIFRMKLTPDSLRFIDRYNKQYYEGDLSFFEKKWGVELDFKVIQALLCQELFAYPSKRNLEKDLKDYRVKKETNTYRLLSPEARVYSRNRKENTHTRFLMDAKFNLLESALHDRVNQRAITFTYDELSYIDGSEYPKQAGCSFPQKIEVLIEAGQVHSTIEVEYKSPRFDKELKLPFTIPDNYTPIEMEL